MPRRTKRSGKPGSAMVPVLLGIEPHLREARASMGRTLVQIRLLKKDTENRQALDACSAEFSKTEAALLEMLRVMATLARGVVSSDDMLYAMSAAQKEALDAFQPRKPILAVIPGGKKDPS